MEFPKPTNRQTAKEKQRSRYETLIFTRLVLLVAVPLLIVGLLCGILYYRSEPARGRAKLGEVAGNASMRMTSVFDGLRSYYLAALRNSSFTWMESCSESRTAGTATCGMPRSCCGAGPIWIPMWSGTNTSISATAGC